MSSYDTQHLANIAKELSKINQNLQSINQTLNRMEAASRSNADDKFTINDFNPKFRAGMELRNS